MKTHFDHLEFYIPDLLERRILDLGSGRGKFLIDAKSRGVDAKGLELYEEYIRISHEKAGKTGLTLDIEKGVAEDLPFPDKSFDFVNICEVIEHVESPGKVLEEVYRVLANDGQAYLSVPNRFGFKDPHFHLYFVNWLPRRWANSFISIFGKHKDYSGQAGRQNLTEMHYSTLRKISKLAAQKGFCSVDMRMVKLKRRFPRIWMFLAPVYILARTVYFDSFHLMLKK